jgi:hypothetical protein
MKKKSVWIAIFAMLDCDHALLMLAGSPNVMANDQPSSGGENRQFHFRAADGHRARRNDGDMDKQLTTFLIRRSAQTACSSPR